MKNKIEKKYRPCVAIFLVNKEKKVFVGKRINSQDSWQIPQGGIEGENESIESAMFRELFEETGIIRDKVEIMACYPHEIQYEIPKDHIPKSWKEEFCGQKVICFFVKFLGSEKDINLSTTNHPEFSEFKWEDPKNLTKNIIFFKKNMYEQIMNYFLLEMDYVFQDFFMN